MRIRLLYLCSVLAILGLFSCTGSKNLVLEGGDREIEVAILQMNDVYEIGGVDNGKQGDLSRVAWYLNSVKEQYPQALMVISGDFLNPSLIGTMKHDGERIRGRQMIEVLNAIPLDLATFGNHEFDIDLEDLQMRINESDFDWVSSNALVNTPDGPVPFAKERNNERRDIPEYIISRFQDRDGTLLNIGFFTALTPVNQVDYVTYLDPAEKALEVIETLRGKCDIVVGLTHLDIRDDRSLAEKVENVPLFIGGHDHNNMFEQVNGVTIAKADANARTVYLHVLRISKRGKINIESKLVPINETVPRDSTVHAVIRKWNRILEENLKQIIDEPQELIYYPAIPLDGRESTIRHYQSDLGKLFTKAMLRHSANNAACALLNSGAIRIDDEIIGAVTAVDIFRALPFGGQILDVTITGELLLKILDFSSNSEGGGAYLQYSGIKYSEDGWLVNGEPVNPASRYNLVINDFLLAGYDMPFLTRETEGILEIHQPLKSGQKDMRSDIRLAIIDYLKSL